MVLIIRSSSYIITITSRSKYVHIVSILSIIIKSNILREGWNWCAFCLRQLAIRGLNRGENGSWYGAVKVSKVIQATDSTAIDAGDRGQLAHSTCGKHLYSHNTQAQIITPAELLD
jgi:hypothetical protein